MIWDLLRARARQGLQTTDFPDGPAPLPPSFRGRPTLEPARCEDRCRACADSCPTAAIATEPLRVDLGKCLFCPVCVEACPTGALAFPAEPRMAFRRREELVVGAEPARLASALDARARQLFGRSLKLREVSAGGCNGCEAELVATGNLVFDLGRFGIQFVASPRHADGLVVTGPVTENMRRALLETWQAIPSPRIVVALGACAISGGPFAGAPHAGHGVPPEIPVDLFVPGCPPHPLTVLDGLLRLLGRIDSGDR